MNVKVSVDGASLQNMTVPQGNRVVDVWFTVRGDRDRETYLVSVDDQAQASWETQLEEGWTIRFAPNKILIIAGTTGELTIAELKKRKVGAVGQIVGSGLNRYVIVEETDGGVKVMALYGTFLGTNVAEAVFEVGDNETAWLEDRSKWKNNFHVRWDQIAARYPNINKIKEAHDA